MKVSTNWAILFLCLSMYWSFTYLYIPSKRVWDQEEFVQWYRKGVFLSSASICVLIPLLIDNLEGGSVFTTVLLVLLGVSQCLPVLFKTVLKGREHISSEESIPCIASLILVPLLLYQSSKGISIVFTYTISTSLTTLSQSFLKNGNFPSNPSNSSLRICIYSILCLLFHQSFLLPLTCVLFLPLIAHEYLFITLLPVYTHKYPYTPKDKFLLRSFPVLKYNLQEVCSTIDIISSKINSTFWKDPPFFPRFDASSMKELSFSFRKRYLDDLIIKVIDSCTIMRQHSTDQCKAVEEYLDEVVLYADDKLFQSLNGLVLLTKHFSSLETESLLQKPHRNRLLGRTDLSEIEEMKAFVEIFSVLLQLRSFDWTPLSIREGLVYDICISFLHAISKSPSVAFNSTSDFLDNNSKLSNFEKCTK